MPMVKSFEFAVYSCTQLIKSTNNKSYLTYTALREDLCIPFGSAITFHRNLIHHGAPSRIYNTTPLMSPRLFFNLTPFIDGKGPTLVEPKNPPIEECKFSTSGSCDTCNCTRKQYLRNIIKDHFGAQLDSLKEDNINQYVIGESICGDIKFLGWEIILVKKN